MSLKTVPVYIGDNVLPIWRFSCLFSFVKLLASNAKMDAGCAETFAVSPHASAMCFRALNQKLLSLRSAGANLRNRENMTSYTCLERAELRAMRI